MPCQLTLDVAGGILPLSNITVDRRRHILERRRSTDSFACETKSANARNEPTPTNGRLTNGIFHTIDCRGTTFIFFCGIDSRGPMAGGCGSFACHTRGALAVPYCGAIDSLPDTNTRVDARNAQGNIVRRYTVPNSVVPGYPVRGFR